MTLATRTQNRVSRRETKLARERRIQDELRPFKALLLEYPKDSQHVGARTDVPTTELSGSTKKGLRTIANEVPNAKRLLKVNNALDEVMGVLKMIGAFMPGLAVVAAGFERMGALIGGLSVLVYSIYHFVRIPKLEDEFIDLLKKLREHGHI